ncbi:arginine--tRNA ligase [Thermodesulfobacteriota bacterium]
MKEKIGELVRYAVKIAYENGEFASPNFPEVEIEEPKAATNGDFSTNISMKMASTQKMPPRKIAETIVKHFNDPEKVIQKIEIAGPGFVNFFIEPTSWHAVIRSVHEADIRYGASDVGKGKRIQIEFVSSNPTGPLHVGHGRGAAVGDSLANILSFCGYDVEKEYYINDSGRQIYTLGRSVFLRLKELSGEIVQFPEECYQGDYIRDLAESIKNRFVVSAGDDEDDAHEFSQDISLLEMPDEAEAIALCARFAAKRILDGMRGDLESFGVTFDNWFSEQSLYESGKVDDVIRTFRSQDVIYENDGALWFKTKKFGDEKDRVVVKKDGQKTYFASDIAYHQDKFERGFDKIINVWGADHHGYIQRLSASIEASGFDRRRFDVILVQLVNLLRGGTPVAMSTRAGEFVKLRDVINEVGCDAARFIFLTRHYESPLEFDLEIAKKKTNENPVYYVQYVHARISSIVRKAHERGIKQITCDDNELTGLNTVEEIELMKTLARYPDAVKSSAEFMEPHRLTFYLMSLASNFHAYYNKHRVLTDDPRLTLGRLYLVVAIQTVIRGGLTLLGVSAPTEM